ncbi:MAG: histidinol-phosphate transaminase [Dysgonamonadaceae bacterium]|jgi:histidinol-phosphate aminotransferase|nr:histidinol-phosphate transaminase [Dysgonamonadaceae bacterium]
MNPELFVRRNIYHLQPYSCARDEFQGVASVHLDANENPYNQGLNRYPDPLQRTLKEKIAGIKQVRPAQIMAGNGSDEAIDLVFRIFCEPREDNVVAMEPTYGMYKVAADINDVEYRPVPLEENFRLNASKMLAAADSRTKAIFLCSPNNPSGNLMKREEMLIVMQNFNGIVVIDEAYIDFSTGPTWLKELDNYANLIVLQTLSKAWGLASMRCGLAFASEKIIALFNKVKYPYNVNTLTQNKALDALNAVNRKNEWVEMILKAREPLAESLKTLPVVEKIYKSDANFLLVKVRDADKTCRFLTEKGIIVRNRSKIPLCDNCLRITVGTPDENSALIAALKEFSNELNK